MDLVLVGNSFCVYAHISLSIGDVANELHRGHPRTVYQESVNLTRSNFFQGLRPRKTKLSADDVDAMEESFMAGTNDDFAALLDTRPQRVALSMLRSQKVKAMKRNQELWGEFSKVCFFKILRFFFSAGFCLFFSGRALGTAKHDLVRSC